MDALHGLFVMFVHVGYWPPAWNEILIAPVPKPGKLPTLRDSCRPIHLFSALANLKGLCLSCGRPTYSALVERSGEQFGFERGHGARDNVLVASTIIEK